MIAERQNWFRIFSLFMAMMLSACAGLRSRRESPQPAPKPIPVSSKTQQPQDKKATKVAGKESGTWRKNAASAEYHFSMAQAYTADGNVDRAIEEYKLTLIYDPESALVHARLSAEYIKKGMLTAAMESAKAALKTDPHFIDARLILAGLYSTSQESEAAIAEYDYILKMNPNHDEATIYKTQVLLEVGRSDAAIQTLKSYLNRNSQSALVWYYLGRAQQIKESHPEAIVAYRRALMVHPGFSQAALSLGYLYETTGLNDQAKEVYQSIFDQNQDLTAANRLATIYLKEQKYAQAIPYLDTIQAADPQNMNSRVKLGLIHMEMKQYSKAIQIFKSILAIRPGSDRVNYYLGSLYEETKDYPKAIDHLQKVSSDSKLFEDATLHVTYLLKQKENSLAQKYIQEALEKNPHYASFYIFEASIEEESNNLKRAIGILEKAVSIFPDHERVRYYLGSLYDREGSWDKSLSQMEAILQNNPEHADALNYIGYTLTARGIRLDDARKLIQRAMALRPNSGYILDSWGWYLFTTGKVSEAIVQLEKAARLAPNEPTILEHLGDAYLRTNLREKALIQYREAVQYAKDGSLKRKIEGKLNQLQSEIVRSKQNDPSRTPAEAKR